MLLSELDKHKKDIKVMIIFLYKYLFWNWKVDKQVNFLLFSTAETVDLYFCQEFCTCFATGNNYKMGISPPEINHFI
jgi:hypothetical protein